MKRHICGYSCMADSEKNKNIGAVRINRIAPNFITEFLVFQTVHGCGDSSAPCNKIFTAVFIYGHYGRTA